MAAPAAVEPVPDRRSTDRVPVFDSVVARDVEVEGSITCTGHLELFGVIRGRLEAEGTVWLRPGSRVVGDVVAAEAVIEAEVEGDVTVATKIDLRSTARVSGSVSGRTVAMGEGSTVGGAIKVPRKGGRTIPYVERRLPPVAEPSPSPWRRPFRALRRLTG